MKSLSHLSILFLLLFLGCKKNDSNNPTSPDSENYQFTRPSSVSPDYLGKQYRLQNADKNTFHFYGSFKPDGTPAAIRSLAYQRFNDTLVPVIIYNEAGKVEFIQTNHRDTLLNELHHFEYSPGLITHRIYHANWALQTFSEKFKRTLTVASDGTITENGVIRPYSDVPVDPFLSNSRWNTLMQKNLAVSYGSSTIQEQVTFMSQTNQKLKEFLANRGSSQGYYARTTNKWILTLIAVLAAAEALGLQTGLMHLIGSLPGFPSEIDPYNAYLGDPQNAPLIKNLLTSKSWKGYSFVEPEGCDAFKNFCVENYSSSCGTSTYSEKYERLDATFTASTVAFSYKSQYRDQYYNSNCVRVDSGIQTDEGVDKDTWQYIPAKKAIYLVSEDEHLLIRTIRPNLLVLTAVEGGPSSIVYFK